MAADYVVNPEEIYARVNNCRNQMLQWKNCFGNTLYLLGFGNEEMHVEPGHPQLADLLEECPEEESTVISFETLRGCQRRIIHTLLIDPLNREIVYARNGKGSWFSEGDRDFVLMKHLKEHEESKEEVDVKYCRLNYGRLRKLL